LKGDSFWSEWDGETARSFYGRIISTMPPDDAGSLAEKDTIDIMAYLLRVNGLPFGRRGIENPGDINHVGLQRPK
jgi:hypothetical protein